MRDDRVPVENAEPLHIGDQRFAVELLAGHGLNLGFQDVHVEGRIVLLGQLHGGLHQFRRAALRGGGSNHEVQSSRLTVQP